MPDKKQRRPSYRKPCPDLPKGALCPLCGGRWACLQQDRKKATKENNNA